jgi:hypothetical protein
MSHHGPSIDTSPKMWHARQAVFDIVRIRNMSVHCALGILSTAFDKGE